MEQLLAYTEEHKTVEAKIIGHCLCMRCGKKWIARKKKIPMTCAKCRSPYWQTLARPKNETEQQKMDRLYGNGCWARKCAIDKVMAERKPEPESESLHRILAEVAQAYPIEAPPALR